ncbi:MAG: hypothetical protein AAB473_00525 [Patescibacteria group bacterium]
MNKVLSFVALAALLSSSFPAHRAFAAGANDLVKCPDFSSVYYIADDGDRYVFPNEKMYLSWYSDFSTVKTISCDDLASFPIGDRLVYQAGTRLVKIPSDPSVYAVESDGVLREIPDEDTAKNLYGDDWSSRVDDVSEAFWSSFTVGAPLEDGEIPEGTVLEDSDGNLFREEQDGSATEIDAALDADKEKVLKEHALQVDDIEKRLGVALALTKVDNQAAIDVLQGIIDDLRPKHVKEEDHTEVPDVAEVDDASEEANDTATQDDNTDEIEDNGDSKNQDTVTEDTQTEDSSTDSEDSSDSDSSGGSSDSSGESASH